MDLIYLCMSEARFRNSSVMDRIIISWANIAKIASLNQGPLDLLWTVTALMRFALKTDAYRRIFTTYNTLMEISHWSPMVSWDAIPSDKLISNIDFAMGFSVSIHTYNILPNVQNHPRFQIVAWTASFLHQQFCGPLANLHFHHPLRLSLHL